MLERLARYPILRLGLLALCAVSLAACAGGLRLSANDRPTHRGVFIGKNASETEGSVGLYQSSSRTLIVLEENFRTSDGTAPRLGFGANGFREDLLFATVPNANGPQIFEVPRTLEPDRFNEVWLWSETRREPIGIARLVRTGT